ncbi:MAG: hypothetical protein M1381_02710 [Deltaproteobacteria bacterium]|nr:hypothetical protein [Deltaproteobacteria bacterium]MCL5792008.1 hypothetical protein [Deltaproteobacteria bacterium]
MKRLMVLALVLAFGVAMTGCHKEEATQPSAPAVETVTPTAAQPASPTAAQPASPTTPAK